MELKPTLFCGGRNFGTTRLFEGGSADEGGQQLLVDSFSRAIEIAVGQKQLSASTILAERFCNGAVFTVSEHGVPTRHQISSVHFDVSARVGSNITLFTPNGFSLLFGPMSILDLQSAYKCLAGLDKTQAVETSVEAS